MLRTSEEWAKLLKPGVMILDPDGWDRENYEHSWKVEKISQSEFEDRFMQSTVVMPEGGWRNMWMKTKVPGYSRY